MRFGIWLVLFGLTSIAQAGYLLRCDKVCASCHYPNVCDCDEDAQKYSCAPPFALPHPAPPQPAAVQCQTGDAGCLQRYVGTECQGPALNGQVYQGLCEVDGGAPNCFCAPD